MKVVVDYPPHYDEVCRVFPIVRSLKEVIFSYGDRIFAPGSNGSIPPELYEHEIIHCRRQMGDVVGWWRRYLHDADFRLAEEVLAHRAEYAFLINKGNRQDRRRALKVVTSRLASPIYGRMTTTTRAKKLILEGIEK